MLITVEGVEGSGKSTQCRRLAESLRARGLDVVLTREPDGTPMGAAIRRLFAADGPTPTPLTQVFLFMAARQQHVAEVIRPALSRGAVVLSDRYADATVAYQGGGRTIPEAFLTSLNEWATGGLRPDRTYLIDVPIELGLKRAKQRTEVPPDRFESESRAFFEAVRARYLEIARREPERIVVLRGTDAEETLAHQIRDDVHRILSGRTPNVQR